MELKREDIPGVVTEKNGLVCNKCATDQEWAAVGSTSNLLMGEKLKTTDTMFFCDRCNTRLKG